MITDDLQDRTVIVTGAGQGIGRHYALHLAALGARVVVNDFAPTASEHPADMVVAEIRVAGGEAVASHADVTDADGVDGLLASAIDSFGGVDALINNAGILRDRTLLNMSEQDWDDVIRVHLRGTFLPTRAAGRYWRDCAKRNEQRVARVINTSSSSGLLGNVGQSNYGAAKAGVASFTQIAAMELARYGVTVNAVAPAARTAMTEGLMAPADGDFDPFDPAAVAPLVGWLAGRSSSAVTGWVFNVHGGLVGLYENWVRGPAIDRGRLWAADEVGPAVATLITQARGNERVPGQREES